MPIRIEKDLLTLLAEGARRTPHKKQELIRITLRRHLREVIEQESTKPSRNRVTNIDPWPKGTLARAYKDIEHEGWDKVEEAAVRASRRPPSMDD
jgi:hypothetical protein